LRGVLLATLLADINLAGFIAMMFPFTLVVVVIGWLPVDQTRLNPAEPGPSGGKKFKPFLKEITPILFVIVAGITLGWLFTKASGGKLIVAKEIGLIIALCAGNLMVWRANTLTRNDIRKIIISPHVFNMVYMIAAILIFKQILESSGAVHEICAELIRLRIPLILVWGILPFVVGLLTGITIAFVGSTFPILITLTTTQGHEQLMMPYIMLALTCGFSGVLLSPVHLCLLLSKNFFGTTLRPVYRLLWFPCACLAGCAFIYFFLIQHVLG
jgi:integral membrane protein (TIGR00529 family)